MKSKTKLVINIMMVVLCMTCLYFNSCVQKQDDQKSLTPIQTISNEDIQTKIEQWAKEQNEKKVKKETQKDDADNAHDKQLEKKWNELKAKVDRIQQQETPPTDTNTSMIQEESINNMSSKTQEPISPSGDFQSNDEQDNVLKRLQQWVRAWCSKDIDTYLSMYDPQFRTPVKMTRKQWEKNRKKKLNKKFIKVVLSEVKVDLDSSSLAMVTFKQDYQSPRYKDSTIKRLILRKHNDVWLIIEEKTLKILKSR